MGSKYSHVFQPIRIRGIDFKNRIVLAPPSPNLASEDGLVTPEFIDWFRMFARGGASTIYVGNSSVDFADSRDEKYQLNMNQESCIRPLARFADMAKQYGCHASMELNHGGENEAFENIGHAPFGASPRISSNESWRSILNHRDPIACQEMSIEKIKDTIDKFAAAAERMKRAGMDIVLVHGGHGNLISQFTSPLYNQRTDEYGGNTKQRARFAIELCDEIRRRCGEDFVIEYRISADELAPESMHFEETLELIGYLKDHIDILHVSAGLHMDFNAAYYRNWCQNYMMDRCFNVHYARDIKKAYPDLLVTTVGSITSLDYAEEILANGWADFVAMCRPLMADPDMPRKYAEGRGEDRRPCLRCDTCTKHLMIPKPIWCAVNPMSAMTTDLPDGVVPKAEVRKKVAVVGGGPAGVQALQTLLDRGHDVTLYEKSGEIGGNIIGAAAPGFKIDMRDYLKWMRHTTEQCIERGAKVLMNTEATKAMLDAENYDAVVICVGADPIIPEKIPGIRKPHVCWAPEAELGKHEVGEKVVVIGAGSVGLEAALDYHQQGKAVEVVEMLDSRASYNKLHAGAGPVYREFKRIFEDEEKIPMHFSTALVEIKDNCVVCRDTVKDEMFEIPCDTVLLAMGMRERWNTVEELRHSAPETSVFHVGDCRKAATISEAVNGAFQACLHI